jgi:uncharacterized phage protein (TIGR01671 family)
MNNRFKFRVFDNINKRYEKDLTLIDKDGDLCYQDGHKYCNGEHPEDFTIEQCTGLTDRHNKLIYENDVVNMYIPYEDKHRKCVVRYCIDEGTAQWLAVYLEGKRPHCSMGICYDIASKYLDGSYCTVIGNIHDDQFREITKKMED